MTDRLTSEVSENARSAIWQHYYQGDRMRGPTRNRRIKKVTKKEIIVRTLKKEAPQGETVSLHELSRMTGLSPHDLSGHMTHLVNEDKVERRGRGLFALRCSIMTGGDTRDQIRSLVEQVARTRPKREIEEKIIISNKDHSENRRLMLDFLSDILLSCSEMEVNIKCEKDKQKGSGKISIELRAQ